MGEAVLAGSQAGELGTFSAPEPASSYLLLSPFCLMIHLCFTLWGWRGERICQSLLSHSVMTPTLCDSAGCSPPGSSVLGFPRQEYWSGLPFLSPGDLPGSGIEPIVSCVDRWTLYR